MPQEIRRLQFLLIPEKAKTAVTLPAAASIKDSRRLLRCFSTFFLIWCL